MYQSYRTFSWDRDVDTALQKASEFTSDDKETQIVLEDHGFRIADIDEPDIIVED